jgi:dsDNA-specific endonuclease/ATPase MutS2
LRVSEEGKGGLTSLSDLEERIRKEILLAYEEKLERLKAEYEKAVKQLREEYQRAAKEFAEKASL